LRGVSVETASASGDNRQRRKLTTSRRRCTTSTLLVRMFDRGPATMLGADQLGPRCTPSFWRTVAPQDAGGGLLRHLGYLGSRSSPPCLPRLLPAGAVAGWALHPLENAALSRRTWKPDLGRNPADRPVAPKPASHGPSVTDCQQLAIRRVCPDRPPLSSGQANAGLLSRHKSFRIARESAAVRPSVMPW
jgi:hypothetical protein